MAKGSLPTGLAGLFGELQRSGGFGKAKLHIRTLLESAFEQPQPAAATTDRENTESTLGAGRLSGGSDKAASGGGVAALSVATLTSGADNWTGGAGVDSVDGLDGDDSMSGLGGNDTLYGSSGSDDMWGGDGDDYIFTGVGGDTAFGGSGVDRVFGGGQEFQFDPTDSVVNGQFANDPFHDWRSVVAALPNGGYVVGWEISGDASGITSPDVSFDSQNITFRRMNQDGTPAAVAQSIDSQHAGGTLGELDIVALQGPNAGYFVVVWFADDPEAPSWSDPNNVHSAFIALFDANGAMVPGTMQRLEQDNLYAESRPTVTALADGSFVTFWQDQLRDAYNNNGVPDPPPPGGFEYGWGIYGQQWRTSGPVGAPTGLARNGGEFQASQVEAGNQALPQSVTLSNGNVVVAWNSDSNLNGLDVMFRVYQPGGLGQAPTALTNELVANQTGFLPAGHWTGNQIMEVGGLTALTGGGFVVAWDGAGANGDAAGVYVRIFENSGAARTLPIAVAPDTAAQHQQPVVTYLQDGGFIVVWASSFADGNNYGLLGQRFDANGNAIGGSFLVNTTTAGAQTWPSATTLANGTVVVTWSGPKDGNQAGNFQKSEVFQRHLRFGSGDGNDTLYGDAGDDLVFGEDGNDTLAGGLGADQLNGATGQDWGNYTDSSALVKVDLTLPSQTGGDAQGDVLTGIEHLYGSAFADTLAGDGAANSLVGNGSDDTLVGRGGADWLHGGAGIDTADYRASAAAVQVILGDGSPESGGDAAGDSLTQIEVIQGSSFADTFGSQAAAATFFGNAGDDVLQGRLGAERLEGGAGNDRVDYLLSTAAVVVNLTTGLGSGGFAAGDSYSAVENIVGSSFADTLTGSAGSNTIDGQAGNDTIFSEQGADTLLGGLGDDLLFDGAGGFADRFDGGAGIDTVSYLGAGLGLAADLASGAGFTNAAAGDVYTGVENLTGGAGGDTLGGNAGANVLNGGLGDDTLEGRAGADTLIGDAGLDWADYLGSVAAVTVTLGHSGAQAGATGDQIGDVLTGIEAVRGSGGNDTLSSLLGAAILDGASGNDLLLGGAGADSYLGGAGSDSVDYRAANPSGVTVNLATGLGSGGLAAGDSYSGVENVLGSVLTDHLIGNSAVNTLAGLDGNDSLTGGSGADSLLGGSGDDILFGGSGADRMDGGAGLNDWASYTLSGSAVQVDLTDPALEAGGDANGDLLTGIEHLVGSDFDDLLTGGAGSNIVYGESGNDRLVGGADADSLFGGSGNDVLNYDVLDAALMGGTGRDTLLGSSGGDAVQMSQARWHFAGDFASFETFDLGDGNDFFNGATDDADFLALSPAVDGIVIFGGSGNDNLNMRGNTATQGVDDSVYGGLGRDNLWGGGGDDSLYGGDGDDALYGGSGDDVISGGSGFDVTYLGRGEGNDAIADSEGLVLFWGNVPPGGFYDGVDPTEVNILYNTADSVVIVEFADGSASAAFKMGAVGVINLFDFGNGDAGNGGSPPPQFARDIWSASWDEGTQTFTAFTKVVDG